MEHSLHRDEPVFPRTVLDWYDQVVQEHPDKTCIEFADEQLTYRQLNERAEALACYLHSKKIKEGSPVALLVERSPLMIIAILGTLKAGCYYVPIDPAYPAFRIQLILEECQAAIVLTTTACMSKLPAGCCGSILLDRDPVLLKPVLPDAKVNQAAIQSDRLAYVIYTSGSTGKPKGVMVTHRNVVNLIQSQLNTFAISDAERILLFANYCFDASVEQIFLALSAGAVLVLFEEGFQLHTQVFEQFIADKEITHFHATPSFLASMNNFNFPAMKRVIAGGEVCSPALAKKINKHISFYNEYGPTETTVTATMFHCPPGVADQLSVLPIGLPLANSNVYLLDDRLQPVKNGEPGEIYIGGYGVAKGYLNKPLLTQAVFLHDTFAGDGSFMYKTGDVGRRSADMSLEYLGRVDDQLKIRGFRIEPGEIETVLLDLGFIRQAAVVGRNVNAEDIALVAFVVLLDNATLEPAGIFDYLRERLPHYMIPARLVAMQYMPLTNSGKIDKNHLRTISLHEAEQGAVGEATDTEQKLISIYKELLSVTQVNKAQSFFRLGGHSLMLVELNIKINKQFGISISPAIFFEDPAIEKLSQVIEAALAEQNNQPEITDNKRFPAVTISQKHLYMAARFQPKNPFPYSSATFSVTPSLDIHRLNSAVQKVTDGNESLRTAYGYQNGEVQAYVHDRCEVAVVIVHSNAVSIDEEIIALTQPFDFSVPPLLRVFVIYHKACEYLHIYLPHINSDGISCQIIAAEIMNAYSGDEPVSDKMQFSDFCTDFYQYLNSGQFETDRKFWNAQHLHRPERITYANKAYQPGKTSLGESLVTALDCELTGKILAALKEKEISVFQYLLTGYIILLHTQTSQKSINIMIPVHGRNKAGFERITGLLTNTVILPVQLEAHDSIRGLMQLLQRQIISAVSHQQYPVECVQSDYRPRTDKKMLHDTFFNYHNYIRDLKQADCHWKFHIHAKNREVLPLSMDVFDNQGVYATRIASVNGVFNHEELIRLSEVYHKMLYCMYEQLDAAVGTFAVSFNK